MTTVKEIFGKDKDDKFKRRLFKESNKQREIAHSKRESESAERKSKLKNWGESELKRRQKPGYKSSTPREQVKPKEHEFKKIAEKRERENKLY